MSLKVLILGANGFIGNSLVKAILKQTDWEICGLDLAENKLVGFLGNSRFNFILCDVLEDKEFVSEQIQKCDVVLPLVAIANPAIYVKDPIRVFELDFESNLYVIRECVKYKKRVVFPSSSEVYGMSPDPSFDEETSPLMQGPINKERWIYSCCKQLLDRVIYGYGTRNKLEFTLFRPFNWIGAFQDDPHAKDNSSRVVTQFISNIIYGQDFRIVGDGNQMRCFTFIEDGIEALLKIIENKNDCASGRIFNIGNPDNDYSIRCLAEKVLVLARNYPKYRDKIENIRILNVGSGKYYGAGYQDIQRRVPSIQNARKYLNWEPKTSLDAALHAILEHHLSS